MPTPSTRVCAPTGSGRRCCCPGPAGPCPTGAAPSPGPSSTTTCAPPPSRRVPRRSTARVRSTSAATATGSPRSSSSVVRRPGRSAAAASWSPTACARRWVGCWAGSGTATPCTASPGARYVDSARADDPWISSHLELRGRDGEILSGYGWIFPLGSGEVNIGVGTLATSKRPAEVAIKPLMSYYADERREEFALSGDLRAPTSALLPMGGAVSGVAGPELGADRGRGRLREPAQRRGHRLRPRERSLRRRADGRARRPGRGVADAAAGALRRGVLDRAQAGRPGDGAAPAARPSVPRACARTG